MTTLFASRALLPSGPARDVLIEVADGRFTSVIPNATPSGTTPPPDATRLRAVFLRGVVLPGFANAHSHAFHRALRGRTHHGGGTFWTWREAMYSLASRLDPDNYLALARAVYAEMALAGITTVGEFHYVHHAPGGRPYGDPNAMGHALQQAANDAGIRLTLLDTCYLEGGLDASGHLPLDELQLRFSDKTVEAWASRVDDIERGRFEGSSAQIFLQRLAALDLANSIILFGSALLISVLPFVILLSSLANHRIDTDLSRHIGLNRQGARIVSQLFRSSPSHSAAAIVTALIFATAGTIAVAGSLQVIYERVFDQPHRGWKDVLRFATWVGVLFGALVADSVISGSVHAAVGPAGQGLVIYAGVAGFFWWTMHFLLAGRVSWRLLLRPAILTALFWIGLELLSSVYFSSSIISDSRLYGTIGVVFSLMVWFIAIGAVIVLGAVAGATWNQQKGRSRRTEADDRDPRAGGGQVPEGQSGDPR